MYVIISPRVGIPGEPFEPTGQDVAYLLAGGFIAEKSAPRATKSAKPIEEEESTEES